MLLSCGAHTSIATFGGSLIFFFAGALLMRNEPETSLHGIVHDRLFPGVTFPVLFLFKMR